MLIVKKAGGVVGELNHSRMFPPAFRPSAAKLIHKRVKKFLETPMVQTGHLPPAGVAADKGTYKHRSRQLLSCVTVMPGGNNWLEVFTGGQG